jgi:hypothetical protein
LGTVSVRDHELVILSDGGQSLCRGPHVPTLYRSRGTLAPVQHVHPPPPATTMRMEVARQPPSVATITALMVCTRFSA